MQVRELMTENPAVCTPDTNLQDVARMMIECDCGAIPIVENADKRKAVGIVTDRDITTRIVARGENPLQKRAADAMSGDVVSVRAGDSVEHCAEVMEKHQVRRVIVTDENGACVGIVAQADLTRHVSDETVGEVVEEISKPSRVGSPATA